MPDLFDVSALLSAVSGGAAALRSITVLQPVEGPGGKLFPSTYAQGKYAQEKRRLQDENGIERDVDCVLLNSCQSEANHAELALLGAIERDQISLPLIEVDFSESNAHFRKPMPNLTSLEVPHRLADAILRDSVLDGNIRFSKSEYAARWSRSNLWNATAIYEICPTALVFGMWGSPEKPGGLGAKFERAFISEIVAVDTCESGKRFGFRIDPASASSKANIVVKPDGTFEVFPDKQKNAVKASEINHGNIPFETDNGGVRCRFAEQTTVISLGALRKLRFPVEGKNDVKRDDTARTVLAAIGLCAGVLASERGISLRSRCNLHPVAPRVWEVISHPGDPAKAYSITGPQAIELLKASVAAAKQAGVNWMDAKLTLKPSKELVDLIRISQDKMSAEGGSEGE